MGDVVVVGICQVGVGWMVIGKWLLFVGFVVIVLF